MFFLHFDQAYTFSTQKTKMIKEEEIYFFSYLFKSKFAIMYYVSDTIKENLIIFY